MAALELKTTEYDTLFSNHTKLQSEHDGTEQLYQSLKKDHDHVLQALKECHKEKLRLDIELNEEKAHS